MASAGCRNELPLSPTTIWPDSGLRTPARQSNSSSWPCPSSAATPSTSPKRSVNDTPFSVPAFRLRTSTATPPVAGALGEAASAATSSATGPSMSLTMRSSPPCAGSTTPTVLPSRSTVARSHSAATSASRCEMKMTERPSARSCRATLKTRTVRSAGRDAVISSRSSSCGSIASARARSSKLRVGRGSSRGIVCRSNPSSPSSAR